MKLTVLHFFWSAPLVHQLYWNNFDRPYDQINFKFLWRTSNHPPYTRGTPKVIVKVISFKKKKSIST